MPTVRLVSFDSEDGIRRHLVRIGHGEVASSLAPGLCGVVALVTGAAPAALAAADRLALRAPSALPLVVVGEPERAAGSALVVGRKPQLAELARALLEAGPEVAGLGRALARALESSRGGPGETRMGPRLFRWGERTYVMGILNVTPDSFSDGGHHLERDAAVAAGLRMADEGADLIDVGGESTRPGAVAVSEQEEMDRVLPIVEQLASRLEVPVSVDTRKARVAGAAVLAGARLVNDVSGFRADPEMAPTLGRLGVAACAMHMRGTPATMQEAPQYLDVVGEVIESLEASVELAVRCGVARERLLVDPGIGFGKTAGHNLFLLHHLGALRALGRPVLVGVSRKSFIGKVTGRPVGERLAGSLAAAAVAALGGADVVRVHDVAETVAALKVVHAVARAGEGGLAWEA